MLLLMLLPLYKTKMPKSKEFECDRLCKKVDHTDRNGSWMSYFDDFGSGCEPAASARAC